MSFYLASDVHLRLDRPDRAHRFARWLDELAAEDTLWILGDLCDFWFATRQSDRGPSECSGLRALAAFRERGGSLHILAGNHDLWLGPFYERVLGVPFTAEPVEIEAYGLRLHMVHGHRLGVRRAWKAGMESRAFFAAFRRAPAPLAGRLDALLERSNRKARDAWDERHLAEYRRYTAGLAGRRDLVVFGHVHRAVDEAARRPRLVVLGGWHERASYLRIDESGAAFIIEPGPVGMLR